MSRAPTAPPRDLGTGRWGRGAAARAGTADGPDRQPGDRRALAGTGGSVRAGRGVERVLVHVLAYRPALPRPAARGKQARPGMARPIRAADGLLALDGGTAVGWCELAPRADLDWLAR